MKQYAEGMSAAVLDNERPHHVAVQSYLCAGRYAYEQQQFYRGFGLSPRIHSVLHDGVSYRVFCFTSRDHARLFAERFRGVHLDQSGEHGGVGWMPLDWPVQTPAKALPMALLW